MMAGFVPLLSAPVDMVFVRPDVDKVRLLFLWSVWMFLFGLG